MTEVFHSHQSRFSIDTRGHRHMHDLTEQVADIIRDSDIRTGVAQGRSVGHGVLCD